MNAAATGTVVSVNDGGWSRGVPVKGSGWRGVVTKEGGTNWEGESSSDAVPSGWGEDNSLENSGSGWLSAAETGSGANRPSSIGADGWGSKSPCDGPSEKGVWGKGNEVMPSSEGMEENRGRESGGLNGVSMWGANKPPRDVVGTNWRVPDDSTGNDDRHSDYSADACSPPSEDSGAGPTGRRKQDVEMGRASVSSGERESHGYSHSQESYRGVNSSPAVFGPSDTMSLGSSGGATSHSDYQSSGNFSSSHDGHVIGSDDTENHGFESPYSRISPRNGAVTPIQAGGRSGGATPIQGARDRGENFWGSGRVGSTSSVSSVGSSSSWKGDSKNGGGAGFPNRSNSPRKNSRLVIVCGRN